MIEDIKNMFKKKEKFDNENREAKRKAPLWLVILNDGFPLFIITLFVCLGAIKNWWHPAWLLFLFIPLYYTLAEAIKHKNAYMFAFPVLAVLIFLAVGFLGKLWHPGWVVLVSIPIYYIVVALIRQRSIKTIIDVMVPVVVAICYIAIGFATHKWHPAWVIFFAIPLYYQITASIAKYKKKEKIDNGTQGKTKDGDDYFIK